MRQRLCDGRGLLNRLNIKGRLTFGFGVGWFERSVLAVGKVTCIDGCFRFCLMTSLVFQAYIILSCRLSRCPCIFDISFPHLTLLYYHNEHHLAPSLITQVCSFSHFPSYRFCNPSPKRRCGKQRASKMMRSRKPTQSLGRAVLGPFRISFSEEERRLFLHRHMLGRREGSGA